MEVMAQSRAGGSKPDLAGFGLWLGRFRPVAWQVSASGAEPRGGSGGSGTVEKCCSFVWVARFSKKHLGVSRAIFYFSFLIKYETSRSVENERQIWETHGGLWKR